MTQPPLHFDDGAAYEQLMGIWSRVAGRLFLDFLSPPPNARWLDVGCGNAAFTELVSRDCAPGELHGIDPSEGQLAFARDRMATRNVSFQIGDAMALPFPDNRFDIAVMALVIHFVPQPERGVAEMARVVRPGGTVTSYVWAYDQAASPLDPFEAELRAAGLPTLTPPSIGVTSVTALRELWEGAGLTEIETLPITATRTFADFDELWTSATGTGRLKSSLAAMDASTVAQVQTALRARLPADAQGRITYASRANAIKGRVPA